LQTGNRPPLSELMYYVYILRSLKDNNLYLGFTEDLRSRLAQHNLGQSKSTRYRIPLELIYYEAYKAKSDAISRERKLKRYSQGYANLKRRLEFSLETQKVGGGKSEHLS